MAENVVVSTVLWTCHSSPGLRPHTRSTTRIPLYSACAECGVVCFPSACWETSSDSSPSGSVSRNVSDAIPVKRPPARGVEVASSASLPKASGALCLWGRWEVPLTEMEEGQVLVRTEQSSSALSTDAGDALEIGHSDVWRRQGLATRSSRRGGCESDEASRFKLVHSSRQFHLSFQRQPYSR
ncbi:hypothetical protein BD309DRAFT_238198 [Dichomitus squalens]|nr:hypothetical protein BD309DRAFT_238198 [Dichomitus squalens]